MVVRVLSAADAAALEGFLLQHRDSSMFLRSNARHGGIDYTGAKLQALYVGKTDGSAISGVVAHGWNGMLLVQAPEDAAELARRCVSLSGRPVTGIAGPREQVRSARAALGLEDAPVTLDANERLYALDLRDLQIPSPLSAGLVNARVATVADLPRLIEWRVHYDVEALQQTPSEEQRRRAEAWLLAQVTDRDAWVAVQAETPVALSAFNAVLPDIVQLGGIYTPTEQRGRGYARAAIAAQLLTARDNGVERAVLFTKNPSAMRCYEALGFQHVDSYGLLLLR